MRCHARRCVPVLIRGAVIWLSVVIVMTTRRPLSMLIENGSVSITRRVGKKFGNVNWRSIPGASIIWRMGSTCRRLSAIMSNLTGATWKNFIQGRLNRAVNHAILGRPLTRLGVGGVKSLTARGQRAQGYLDFFLYELGVA